MFILYNQIIIHYSKPAIENLSNKLEILPAALELSSEIDLVSDKNSLKSEYATLAKASCNSGEFSKISLKVLAENLISGQSSRYK